MNKRTLVLDVIFQLPINKGYYLKQMFQVKVSPLVARRHKIAPSHLFLWRRLREEGTLTTLACEENVVPESEVKKLKKRIRELERQLGRKTMDVEILKEGIELARKKKLISPQKLPG